MSELKPTAIDELRRMLDERGVHWWTGDDERKTLWESNGLTWEYFNDENGDAWLGFLGACEQDITPEQAIAATLGGGECECVWNEQDGTFRCSSCDTPITNEISIEWPSYKVTPIRLPNYCPNCGARVEVAE